MVDRRSGRGWSKGGGSGWSKVIVLVAVASGGERVLAYTRVISGLISSQSVCRCRYSLLTRSNSLSVPAAIHYVIGSLSFLPHQVGTTKVSTLPNMIMLNNPPLELGQTS